MDEIGTNAALSGGEYYLTNLFRALVGSPVIGNGSISAKLPGNTAVNLRPKVLFTTASTACIPRLPDRRRFVVLKEKDLSPRIRILLSAQRALLGEVPPSLRMAALDWDERWIYLRCYFDGLVSEEDRESMESITTEMTADFFPELNVELQVIRLDVPSRLEQPARAVAYLRRED